MFNYLNRQAGYEAPLDLFGRERQLGGDREAPLGGFIASDGPGGCDLTTRMRPGGGRAVALFVLVLVLLPGPAAAGDEEKAPGGFATAGSLLCTLVYSPVKLAYAASGLLVGSMAWLWSFGSERVSRPIYRAALKGDYVVLPEHLTGARKLEFRGHAGRRSRR
jgi:hypothetical protein